MAEASSSKGFQGTPGPWAVEMHPAPNGQSLHISAPETANRGRIAQVFSLYSDGGREKRANARLIASAPDLLKAAADAALLIKQMDGIIGSVEERSNPWNETLRQLRAALSTALGEDR